ncbi:conserved protein, unknown function [Hepatocystis sp. ex Piliocolobus tephrosceles]|nr:conserved protein, unknown function [Hepatocystis sp. ex Piliocolobus tephrosceles]
MYVRHVMLGSIRSTVLQQKKKNIISLNHSVINYIKKKKNYLHRNYHHNQQHKQHNNPNYRGNINCIRNNTIFLNFSEQYKINKMRNPFELKKKYIHCYNFMNNKNINNMNYFNEFSHKYYSSSHIIKTVNKKKQHICLIKKNKKKKIHMSYFKHRIDMCRVKKKKYILFLFYNDRFIGSGLTNKTYINSLNKIITNKNSQIESKIYKRFYHSVSNNKNVIKHIHTYSSNNSNSNDLRKCKKYMTKARILWNRRRYIYGMIQNYRQINTYLCNQENAITDNINKPLIKNLIIKRNYLLNELSKNILKKKENVLNYELNGDYIINKSKIVKLEKNIEQENNNNIINTRHGNTSGDNNNNNNKINNNCKDNNTTNNDTIQQLPLSHIDSRTNNSVHFIYNNKCSNRKIKNKNRTKKIKYLKAPTSSSSSNTNTSLNSNLKKIEKPIHQEEKLHEKSEMNIKKYDLLLVALSGCIPFIFFGFVDNTFMIIAGDLFDSTFCIFLGFSTMAAAGLGNLTSDVLGIFIGGYIEKIIVHIGFPKITLTNKQLKMNRTRKYYYMGSATGIAIGCLLGMAPLLFIDNDVLQEKKNIQKKKKKKLNNTNNVNPYKYKTIFELVSNDLTNTIKSEYAFLFLIDQTKQYIYTYINDQIINIPLSEKLLSFINDAYTNKQIVNYKTDSLMDNVNNSNKVNVTTDTNKKTNCVEKDITKEIKLTLKNIEKADSFFKEKKIQIRESIAAPVVDLEGSVVGVIVAINAKNKVAFDKKDANFLTMFCPHIAQEIEDEKDLNVSLKLCKNAAYN